MTSLLEQLQNMKGLDIESPFTIEVNGHEHCFDCLIRGYGASKGMIIDKSFKKFSSVQDKLWAQGYGFSCFNILESTASAEGFIDEVLIEDWGKTVP